MEMRMIRANKNFYPRSPCGERLTGLGVGLYLTTISIHALLAESDVLSLNTQQRHLPFLSTLSLRRATNRGPYHVKRHKISIHALLAESDYRISAK